jgi:hypothetical protein
VSASIRRHVKVRAYFVDGTVVGNAEVVPRRAPFPYLCAGDMFEGITATYRDADCNYVRLDIGKVFPTVDEADAAATALLHRVVESLL